MIVKIFLEIINNKLSLLLLLLLHGSCCSFLASEEEEDDDDDDNDFGKSDGVTFGRFGLDWSLLTVCQWLWTWLDYSKVVLAQKRSCCICCFMSYWAAFV